MGCLVRPLITALLGLTLVTACAHEDPYPPAVPVRRTIPWDNGVAFVVNTPPPPELAWKELPRVRNRWRPACPPRRNGRLWQRRRPPSRCVAGKASAAPLSDGRPGQRHGGRPGQCRRDRASHPLNTTMGTSAQTRYPLDLRVEKMYEVHTSPSEASYLLLPEGERLAAKMLLNPVQWEVTYGKNGAEGSRREVVAIRPTLAPLVARGLLVLQSGVTIHLRLLARSARACSVSRGMCPRRRPPCPRCHSISVPHALTMTRPTRGIPSRWRARKGPRHPPGFRRRRSMMARIP